VSTIEENRTLYQRNYDWQQGGEEWSWPWGGSDMQWYGTWMPRLQRFLPAPTILEIGCGFGRWSAYLQTHCQRLLLVDIAERCADACRTRFAGQSHIECFSNDGTSLEMIPNAAVDFVCSFDSLVHVDNQVLAAYVRQIADKLSAQGVGFIHHSNLGACLGDPFINDEPMLHDRDPGGNAEQMRAVIEQAGLICCGQELINWGTRRVLIDCLTTFARPESPWARHHRLLCNDGFMDEVARLGRLAELYSEKQQAAPAIEL
jgi:SAM-dependent methyltransferase